MSILYGLALFVFLCLCFLLCFIIFLQEGKSGAMGSSFGGGEAQALFGAATADVVKKMTAYLAFFFFLSCLLLNMWTVYLGKAREHRFEINSENTQQQ